MLRQWFFCALVFICTLAHPIQAGGLANQSVPSAALGHPINIVVYAPPGDPPATGWPVLYLLHGHNGDQTSWVNLGDIQATLDRMISEQAISPLLVVMPDAANSWYVDSKDLNGPGNYETALTQDLPNWVETTYPVRRDRAGRAVAGLSMGGFGALHFAMSYPQKYVAAASLSGAIWQNIPRPYLDKTPDELQLMSESAYFQRVDPATIVVGPDIPNLISHFNGSFGTPFDARLFNQENLFTTLETRISEKSDLPAMYLTVGDDDSRQLWRGAIAMYETLQAAQRPGELRITEGDHVWSLWRVAIIDALKFIDTQF
ncbi:hypothetical protein P775_15920 [Puniceibacterium antarcticum]|uniref:Esterase n=1 Tax=Puniceibacterium antarcticum TaxID=1206336 RepID=A0A2G8RCA9_9RHOB|nr:alpha/beta hydrolase family protein [Puniceibacterium antarcticum]PIL19199.1 hypothetical protein P775_15920 [Puniceibacterium antarcticum]